MNTSYLRLSSCFLDARLDLSDEDIVAALALTECSARPYAELIKSNIPSSSSLLPARSTVSRPSPLSTLGVFSFEPTAATPTRGKILIHLGATSRKPMSAKRKKPSSSKNDRPVPAKVQKLGESPPSPVREQERASPPWPRFGTRARLLLLLPKSRSGGRRPRLLFRNWGRLLLLLPQSQSGGRRPLLLFRNWGRLLLLLPQNWSGRRRP